MKPLLHLTALTATAFLAIACTAPDGSGLSFDPLAGVCVRTERGAVCYHPATKAWTFTAAGTQHTQPLTVIRQDNGTVTLSTATGGQLVYRNGRIEWPTEPDRGK
jgi:hypothetical protein